MQSGRAAHSRTQIRGAHLACGAFSLSLLYQLCLADGFDLYLLIFILLLYFHDYFVSKVHLSWSFSFLLFSVSSCSVHDGVVWHDGS